LLVSEVLLQLLDLLVVGVLGYVQASQVTSQKESLRCVSNATHANRIMVSCASQKNVAVMRPKMVSCASQKERRLLESNSRTTISFANNWQHFISLMS
jgi:hypothetical protein